MRPEKCADISHRVANQQVRVPVLTATHKSSSALMKKISKYDALEVIVRPFKTDFEKYVLEHDVR